MNKFRDVYREACRELPNPSMDAEKVCSELEHRRRLRQRRRHLATKGCAAAVVFLLCGVGTVAAKNYRNSLLQLEESSFTITRQQPAGEQAKNQRSSGDIPEEGSFLKMGGVFSIEEDIPENDIPADSIQQSMNGDWTDKMQMKYSMEDNFANYDFRNYNSLDAFCQAEKIVAVVPDKTLFGEEFTWEDVQVIDGGRYVMIRLSNEDTFFSLNQVDNRDVESYSSSTSYGGRCANKRYFINSQGLSYMMFDSVDEMGQVLSVHAVISVNGWDLSVTFEDFGEEVVEKVLDSFDLSIYF